MARSTKEWIGRTDDTPIPTRVKLRVFERYHGRCANLDCQRPINSRWPGAYDHCVALVNGGEHRERNLQLLCVPCHAVKTKADVGQKKKDNRVKAKHIGIKTRKGRPMPGSRDSGIKMKIGGGWERR